MLGPVRTGTVVCMDTVRFHAHHELVAPLYGLSPAELRRRDASAAEPPFRWLAVRDGDATAAATARLRPDERMFLHFVGPDHGAYGPLGEHAAGDLGRPIFVTLGEDSGTALGSLRRAGFVVDMVSEGFRVRFDDALEWLRRAWVPSGFAIISAEEADEGRLFDLDNALRQQVPGTEGWRGNREWFEEELAERPPFDPAAYLVAIDVSSGDYAGLVRIWRNPTGPRLGLIGVLPRFRSAPIAAALLQRALAAASAWGHHALVTETSVDNAAVHPRLSRIGESTGRFVQMVRDPSS